MCVRFSCWLVEIELGNQNRGVPITKKSEIVVQGIVVNLVPILSDEGSDKKE